VSVSRLASPPHFGHFAFVKLGHAGQRRAGAGDLDVFRQHDGQLLVRYRHVATGRAVDDRDRAAPVALAGNAPVAQAELHFFVAEALGGNVGGNGVDRGFVIQTIVFAGIDADATLLVAIPIRPGVKREVSPATAMTCLMLRLVFLGEGKVALVVRRHAHHSAVAVAHQHVIADPDFDLLASERMGDENAGGHALLFHRRDVGLGHAALLAFLDECGQCRVIRCGMGGQRMFGGNGAEGDAHDGVGAGGENPQLLRSTVQFIRKCEAHAGALADPVLLHQAHLFRPSWQVVELGQQFLGVGGDFHVIHGDLALFDDGAGAPALAVDDLLVGQHGVVYRVPIYRAELFVNQAFFVEAGEQPLFPAVVLGGAGGEFAFPVNGKAE
jgi:hypothetical protein